MRIVWNDSGTRWLLLLLLLMPCVHVKLLYLWFGQCRLRACAAHASLGEAHRRRLISICTVTNSPDLFENNEIKLNKLPLVVVARSPRQPFYAVFFCCCVACTKLIFGVRTLNKHTTTPFGHWPQIWKIILHLLFVVFSVFDLNAKIQMEMKKQQKKTTTTANKVRLIYGWTLELTSAKYI